MNAEKERMAIQRLKAFEPSDGYHLAYSGGKDSDCIKILAQVSGVKWEAHHNLTTVDTPETVRYVKSQTDVVIDYPEISMWRLIEHKKIPPTRLARYCCEVLKERGGKGKVVITGVRWAESGNRKENTGVAKIIGRPKTTKAEAEAQGANYRVSRQGGMILNNDNDPSRRMVEQCYRTRTTTVNPIVDWTDADVWNYLRYYGCQSNPLYQCGYKRIGCIGCPMAGKHRYAEFTRYPTYRENYVRAFDRMLAARERDGMGNDVRWRDGEAVMRWWMGEDSTQLRFDDIVETI